MTILVCAATRSELGACARGIHACGALAGSFETLLTGVGLVRAAKSVGDRLEREGTPSLIVSSGFAGVLSAGIAVGVWLTATSVAELRDGTCVGIPEVTLREAPPPALPCTIVSSRVLQHGSSAGALAQYGDGRATLAVDMESAAIAREAARVGIPMMVLRFVTDTPQQPLPGFLSPFAAAMAATRARARVAHTASAVRSALGDPRGVASLVRNGSAWSKELARGWQRFAHLIA